MKRLSILILFAALIGAFQSNYAQHEETSILIDANLSIPTGDYGETIGDRPQKTRRFGFDFGEDVGLASMGYGIGIEINTPAFYDNLAWVISARVIMNPTDDSEVNNYFSNVLDDTTNLSIETGTWFHIPVLTGFSYGFGLSDDINLYISLQGGLNITNQASRKATVDGVLVEETTFETEIDFGYGGGISLEFMDKYNLGFKYLNLTRPRFEGNRYLDVEYFDDAYLINNPIFGDERPIQMFLISLGYRI